VNLPDGLIADDDWPVGRLPPVPTEVEGSIELHQLDGETATIGEWTSQFHLALVVVDPFTFESAWILEVAGQLLREFSEADCRTAWLVTGTRANARQFLGPWAQEMLTFVDTDRSVTQALGIEYLPAFVHLNVDHDIESLAEGWEPADWQEAADHLTEVMDWSVVSIAKLGGPAPFEGSAALG
jgi:hypothetical protein